MEFQFYKKNVLFFREIEIPLLVRFRYFFSVNEKCESDFFFLEYYRLLRGCEIDELTTKLDI